MSAPNKNSLFQHGGFVIALILLSLLLILVTWSISFKALLFGVLGVVVSVASCGLDHSTLGFREREGRRFSDENWAYFIIRGLIGAILGAALVALAGGTNLNAMSGASIAALAFAGGYLSDKFCFKRQ